MFAQESVMDIQELGQFESVYKPSKEVAFCWLRKQYAQLSTEEDHTEIANHANDSLRIWQAAKAQAVPEGFVLVDKHQLAQLMANMDSFGKKALGDDYVSFADIAAVLDEAQEPAND